MTSTIRNSQRQTALTLGPLLFNWPVTRWRDFYFRIADEAPVETVYLGEVVCAKRTPLHAPMIDPVIERLERGGKHVVRSTLALVLGAREASEVRDIGRGSRPAEVNDVSALAHVQGRSHVIGPFVNVYNEATLELLIGAGATRICVPPELPRATIAVLARAADAHGAALEVIVYGRLPLALSARCYHARVHGLDKQHCQYVCERDPDGMSVRTLDDEAFVAINGIQTLSHACTNLTHEIPDLVELGVTHLRLSPHSAHMVEIAACYRRLLDGQLDAASARHEVARLSFSAPFANGFYHGVEGAMFKSP
jgi:O2-independent ubiquinone biosynthesis protein UbiV